MGAAIAAGLYVLTGIPLPVVLGLLSGGVTNTPSLAAGQEMLRTLGAPAPSPRGPTRQPPLPGGGLRPTRAPPPGQGVGGR